MNTILSIQDITRDPQCQARSCLIPDTIDQYAEDMAEGATFPPVVVFHDGQTHWLADGFHRVAAAEKAGLESIECDIREGGMTTSDPKKARKPKRSQPPNLVPSKDRNAPPKAEPNQAPEPGEAQPLSLRERLIQRRRQEREDAGTW
jgi:hypothetical protein